MAPELPNPADGSPVGAFDIPRAGQYLGGIGRSSIYRLIADGKLPVVHIGRRIVIRRAALDALLDELEAEEVAP